MLRRLVNTISCCQLLRQDSSAEVSNPEASRADQPPRQPKEKSVASNLSLAASSAPLKEHLLPKDSRMSPVLLNGPASIESQWPGSASQPPETLTPGRCCSPPLAPSHPSHSPDPGAYTPSMPYPRMVGLQCDPTALETPQSMPLPDLPSPMPMSSVLNYSRRSNQITTDINHMSRPSMSIQGLDNSCRPAPNTAGLKYATRHSPTTPGLNNTCRPTYTSAGLNSCMPTPNIPSHECSSRPTCTSPGLFHYSRHTSNTPEFNTSIRSNSTTQGLKNFRNPTLTAPGCEYSSRPTSTPGKLDSSSRPPSRSPGLNNSKEPPSSSPRFINSNSPTSPNLGLANSNRPATGPPWSNISAQFRCQSISSHSDSSQDCLSISLEEASFWKGPTYRHILAGEPTFINPAVQEMLEVQISKRVHLKVWKENGKKRSDDVLGCMGGMLESWSSKQNITTSHPFCSRNCQSEQLAGNHQIYYQKVSGNHVQMTCSQFFWGLPFLHSESIVATVNMVQSSLDTPSIFFNGLTPYTAIQSKSDIPAQLISLKPLPHQLIQSHPVIPKMSDSPSPVAGNLTQACNPTSDPKPQCHSPPVRNNGVSYSNASRYQLSDPPAIEDLEKHLMKKQEESRNNLPDRVKKSHEAFLEGTSKHCVSKNQRSHFHFPGEILDPELQQHLEQHLKKRFYQLHGQWPKRVHPPLNLIKCQEEPIGIGQTEVNYVNSCPSSVTDDTTQYPQSDSSTFSEIAQSPMEPSKDLTNCASTIQKDLVRSPKNSLGKDLEIISNAEVESSYLRHQRIEPPSVSAEVHRKELPKGKLPIHSSSKWNHTDNSKMPLEKTSCHNLTPCKNDSNGPSFLDPGAQKVLDAHLTRRLVRHRWGLPLRCLKIIQVFTMTKAASLPLSWPSNTSLSFGDSRNDSIPLKASVHGEPFLPAQEEKVLKEDSTVESTKHPLAEIQLEFPRASLHSDNSGPSETCATIHEDSLTSGSTPHSLIGRAWHCNNLLKSQTSNPGSTPGLIKGMGQSSDSEQVPLGIIHQGVSVRNISTTSQSPSSRNTRELEEVEEEESCDRALTMIAQEVANSPTKNKHLRDFKSLETIGSPSTSRTIDKVPEVSGLHSRHCSASGVVLQDCATGTFLRDCAPEVLLAADILASRASQSSHKNVSTTRKSSCQHRHHFPSRGGTVPVISKSQEPCTNHNFSTNNQNEYRSPRQTLYHSRTRPSQVYNSQNQGKNLGEKIKSFVFSIFKPKEKVMENPRPKIRVLSSPIQSQGAVVNRLFVPQQVDDAKDLMTSAAWVAEEKQKIHCRCASSVNYQEAPKASGGGHICRHRIRTAESKITQRNTRSIQVCPKVNIHPSTDKSMFYRNKGTELLSPHVPQAAIYHPMEQAPRVTGSPRVHCPRHCSYRNAIYGKENAFPKLEQLNI
ncbi:spermatogenesis-associated protein 31A3-like [Phodopus roborovskii]|uniref:spermatogenesis-associated protein 31A3-like n=1 Tax=Phodopus roborovskii TaxID=109678 RepID=UPI0021E4B910|nr:spermatogenesis-associated protein 31A3-like [Phodopus roborovskii]